MTVDLRHGEGGDELAEYLVLVLGLVKGLKLMPEGWYHFYRVAVPPRRLSDFTPTEVAIVKVLESAAQFWLAHPKVRSLLLGALHWQLFSRSYFHWFERFEGQYRVVDACFRILVKTSDIKPTNHTNRISRLCESLGLPIPPWSVVENASSKISRLRNRMVHEGLVGEHPTSYETPVCVLDIGDQLEVFTTRILLAIVGLENLSYFELELDHAEPFTLDV